MGLTQISAAMMQKEQKLNLTKLKRMVLYMILRKLLNYFA